MDKLFEILDFFYLRTPSLPLSSLWELKHTESESLEDSLEEVVSKLMGKLHNPQVREAIYLASPNLLESIDNRYESQQDLEQLSKKKRKKILKDKIKLEHAVISGKDKRLLVSNAFALAVVSVLQLLLEVSRIQWLLKSGEFWKWMAYLNEEYAHQLFIPHMLLGIAVIFLPILNFKAVNRNNLDLQKIILLVYLAYMTIEIVLWDQNFMLPGWHRIIPKLPFWWMISILGGALLLTNVVVLGFRLLPELKLKK